MTPRPEELQKGLRGLSREWAAGERRASRQRVEEEPQRTSARSLWTARTCSLRELDAPIHSAPQHFPIPLVTNACMKRTLEKNEGQNTHVVALQMVYFWAGGWLALGCAFWGRKGPCGLA